MNQCEFVKWLEYGYNVIPYFEHQIMREFKIDKKTLEKWMSGKYPNQYTIDAVIVWMKDNGYKKV